MGLTASDSKIRFTRRSMSSAARSHYGLEAGGCTKQLMATALFLGANFR